MMLRFVLFSLVLLEWPTTMECRQNAQPAAPETPAFTSRLNVVLVPVIVRNTSGEVVGNLKREDFQVFDNGKLQTLTGFTVEKNEGTAALTEGTQNAQENSAASQRGVPSRFIVFLFDDLHLSADDLTRVQMASAKIVADSISGSDAGAVFSISGKTNSGITNDRAKLTQAIMSVREQSIYRAVGQKCPNISYYEADLILNRNQQQVLDAAVQETMACTDLLRSAAEMRVRAVASNALNLGNQSSQVTLEMIKFIVQKMGALPGQRTLILISPGFLIRDESEQKSEIINAAARANITISTIDARGLYVTALPASQSSTDLGSPDLLRTKGKSNAESMAADEDVLAELADGTGGTYFHGSNDLLQGFRKLTLPPEFLYLLEFSPSDTKRNGSYHLVKIKLNEDGLNAQARRGSILLREPTGRIRREPTREWTRAAGELAPNGYAEDARIARLLLLVAAAFRCRIS
jgi:VWFA-related protein